MLDFMGGWGGGWVGRTPPHLTGVAGWVKSIVPFLVFWRASQVSWAYS